MKPFRSIDLPHGLFDELEAYLEKDEIERDGEDSETIVLSTTEKTLIFSRGSEEYN